MTRMSSNKTNPTRRTSRSWQLFSTVAAGTAVVIAMLSLLGWLLGIRGLNTWIADTTPMKISGSLGIILIAGTMVRITWKRRIDRGDRKLLAIAVVSGFLSGSYGIALSVLDRFESGSLLLSTDKVFLLAEDPFRIPMASAVSFALMALALWRLPIDRAHGTFWSAGLALASAANAMLTLFGYAYGVPSFFDETVYVPMPLPIAVSFLLVSLSIATSNPRGNLISIIFSNGTAGRTVRKLLPAALLIPFVLGALHLVLESSGLMGRHMASAVQSTLTAAVLAGVILAHAAGLDRREKLASRLEKERNEEIQSRQLLWQISDDLLCTAGIDGYFQRLNPAWERTLGWTTGELMSRPFLDLVHEDDRDKTLGALADLASGERAIGFTNRYRHRNGGYRVLQWSSAPQGDRVIAIARDITDMMHARKRILDVNRELETRVRLRTRELEAANKELESFSYAVSHDLRAPLRAIEGFSKLVLDRYSSEVPQEGQHFLQRVRAGATKMAELIDGIQKLSRLNQGEVSITRVDLSEMAEDIIGDLRAGEADRHVEIRIEPRLVARGDRSLIRSLLLNLIGNAWKFTANASEARIEIGRIENNPDTFFVRDNGAGFDHRHAAKLFTPFQRLHTRDEFEGTGLGLAIVQRVVNRHGGFVSAEGEPGEGACFYFSLTASDQDHLERSSQTEQTNLLHGNFERNTGTSEKAQQSESEGR